MGSPVRVLHTVVNMNRGGAETLIMNLYRNMDRSKVQFDFLTCKEGVFDDEIRELGGTIHRIPYITDGGHFRYIRSLNAFFSQNRHYKIVHSHLDKMSGFVMQAAKKYGIPVRIAHSHNTQSEGNFLAKTYKDYAGRLIHPSSTHLFSCSQAAAEWLFGDRGRVSILLKNGIDSEQFKHSSSTRNRIRLELGITNQYVIGHVGRFNLQKNHNFLIDVFNECSKNFTDLHLVLAGDGPLRNEMEQKVKNLNLSEKVSFLGIRSDIHHLLQAFDLFAFPSLHEGLPVTLVEAQGAGLPCIISDKITREADMGIDLITYLPISQKEDWAAKIPKILLETKQRNIPQDALASNGYDIRNTSKWAQGFYLEAAR
ncbi:glycosyltransferase family 1 protein [Metabacillus sp. KIGAM252]|uniref:Glycosyltransferase family 1 protein n=1 Tax=Metabacillus flavus TaxID=2823519 RepID=A0ABS5LFX6_9BACI|nr:glycosyltransferase family 1 protein [Metabacillus flavus]MBS2969661.1 glycosyltransferase family 1 protein [Metabacillus flavus]